MTLARPAVVSLEEVSLRFDGSQVLQDVTLNLEAGTLNLLRGGNGSGKTTLLNVISGFLTPDKGRVRLHLNGTSVTTSGHSPEALARAGLGRVWQDIRLFPTMSVLDNVLAASPSLLNVNPLFALAAFPWIRCRERDAREMALRNLERVGLADRVFSSCDMLSVGQMKRVALARLLQMNAKLWLLDEPFAGLDAESVKGIKALLGEFVKTDKVTVLLVEHRYDIVRDIADNEYVLSEGRLN